MRRPRQIVTIDEEKCTGCGDCIVACAEGAIEIIDGKAKLISEIYCDGLGACLGTCPEDAITIEEREADPFDEEAVREHLATQWIQSEGGESGPLPQVTEPPPSHCPSAQMVELRGPGESSIDVSEDDETTGPALRHWPIKLRLVPPGAPFLEGSDVALVADCVPFAYPRLLRRFSSEAAVLIGCPKFDEYDFAVGRLTEILQSSNIRSLSVVHMEVPCCFGYRNLAQQALEASGKTVPLHEITIGVRGEIKNP